MSNKSVTAQMQEILKEVGSAAEDALQEGLEKAPKGMVKTLKSTSPKLTGDYAKGWRVLKVDKHLRVVHNATMPGLTHLLEKGHVIKNATGSYGRANAQKHIEPAEQESIQLFVDTVMDGLNRSL